MVREGGRVVMAGVSSFKNFSLASKLLQTSGAIRVGSNPTLLIFETFCGVDSRYRF